MAAAENISAPSTPTSSTVRLNAHAPLVRIIDALAASGWGDLRDAPQSVRSYLLALGRLAHPRSGVAEVTDAQVAERAGLSVRTIMRARTWLQEHGIVVMLRRGARQGTRGVASLISVTKLALVALLPRARAAKDARARARAARPGGAPNLTGWRAFPSLRRKTAAPSSRVARPGRSTVQKVLAEHAEHAAGNPPRPETLASIRAVLARN
jgi:DNA-binding transcriptional ArsR family regulator